MNEPTPAEREQLHRRKVAISYGAVVVIATAVLALFGYAIVQNRNLINDFRRFRVQRAKETTAADARLCNKVDKLDVALINIVAASAQAPKPGEYGYAYFKAHPEEASSKGRLHGQVDKAILKLRSAACDPSNLPTAGKGP